MLVGAIGLLPTYALQQGFSTSVSFNVVAIINALVSLFSQPPNPSLLPPTSSTCHPLRNEKSPQLTPKPSGSILGRLLSGPLSDHLGPYNTVLLCLIFISLLANFAFFLPTSLLSHSSSSTSLIFFYLYASLSGLGSGAVMSAAPLCIAALCPSHVYARWWGASQVGVAIAYVSPFLFRNFPSLQYPSHLDSREQSQILTLSQHRCFLSVPLASIILSRVAPSLFISFFGFVIFLSGLAFALARWEVLGRGWMWKIRV